MITLSIADQIAVLNRLAVENFAAIGTVTDFDPFQNMVVTTASTADFDYIAAVANHVFYIERIFITETSAIAGTPGIVAYDITPTGHSIYLPNLNPDRYAGGDFWCTRLAHIKGNASAGAYNIMYSGWDLTYT